MSNDAHDRAAVVVKRALEAIKAELVQQRGSRQQPPVEELEACERYLEAALADLSSSKPLARAERPRGMGAMIVDQWPLDSKLGEQLLHAEQAYLAA